MSYRMQLEAPVAANVRRVLGQQIDRARRDLTAHDAAEAVHRFRKRCKKIRALLRLVRPALGKQFRVENDRFRDMARRVAAARDAQVLGETFDRLLDAYDDEIDRRHYVPARPRLSAGGESGPARPESAVFDELDAELAQARAALAEYRFSADGFEVIADGLARSYDRARTAMKQACANPTAEAYHDWRKQVKYHRHHCDLLRDLWTRPMKARASELQRLADWLGDEHDLAILAARVEAGRQANPDNRSQQAVLTLIDRRRSDLQRACEPLGRCLFAEKQRAFRKRMVQYRKARRRA
ncbi:CHAD domain-containing protein [Salinisphaera sp. RV14]|uniref:CHAD domain-containing protein n=1 Tax=Salinisphaera sp. RV14 TaxID=3454140 RepID=UPI003F87EE2C